MNEKITIWTLNDTTDLIQPNQSEVIKIFNNSGYDAVFGNRSNFNTDSNVSDDSNINLMPGTEYFVPIAPKCIGDLFDSSDNDTIQKIRDYYETKSGQIGYKNFWEFESRDYKMLTTAYKGYYSILRETAPNFLIGYSQGGLVARYLLWLAENVFQETSVVKGIITVSSPNFGSPLANPDNSLSIILGFVQIILILFSNSKDNEKLAEMIAADITIDDLRKFLHAIINRTKPERIHNLSFDDIKKLEEFNSILTSLYDWLGGLRNDPNDAFYDLNIFRLNYPYSVLSSIDQSEPDTKIRGILSTNNSLSNIIFDLIIKIIWDEIKKCFSSRPVLSKALISSNIGRMTDQNLLMTSELKQDKIQEIEKVINTVIMTEHPMHSVDNPIIKARINDYANGVGSLKIASNAHDFVIPSAYQLTTKPGGLSVPVPYNNPNFMANHLSGSDLFYLAGKENYRKIINILPEMLSQT
jgi:hypothetical protein